MPQLPQRLGFDLPDTLAGNCERLADFFEGVLAAVFETKPHLDDLFFARRQNAKHVRGLVLQIDVDHRLGRRYKTLIVGTRAADSNCPRPPFPIHWRYELLRHHHD